MTTVPCPSMQEYFPINSIRFLTHETTTTTIKSDGLTIEIVNLPLLSVFKYAHFFLERSLPYVTKSYSYKNFRYVYAVFFLEFLRTDRIKRRKYHDEE